MGKTTLNMTASVLIPTKIHPEYLHEALDSVLNQTRKPKEVIILFEGENLSAKLNQMVRMTSADAYTVLSDDDLLDPLYLEKTLDQMERTSADVVYTAMEQFGNEKGIHQGEDWNASLFPTHVVAFFTALCKKSAWEKSGGYDERVTLFEDWDFWWSCSQAGCKGIKIPEPLFKYRTYSREEQMERLQKLGVFTRTEESVQKNREYILRKHGA